MSNVLTPSEILELISILDDYEVTIAGTTITMPQEVYNKVVIERNKAFEDNTRLMVDLATLRSTIATYLVALEPWYIEGSVVDPMVAVNALKTIHREVHK